MADSIVENKGPCCGVSSDSHELYSDHATPMKLPRKMTWCHHGIVHGRTQESSRAHCVVVQCYTTSWVFSASNGWPGHPRGLQSGFWVASKSAEKPVHSFPVLCDSVQSNVMLCGPTCC